MAEAGVTIAAAGAFPSPPACWAPSRWATIAGAASQSAYYGGPCYPANRPVIDAWGNVVGYRPDAGLRLNRESARGRAYPSFGRADAAIGLGRGATFEIYLALARLDIAIGVARHYSLLIDFRPDDLDLLWRQSR